MARNERTSKKIASMAGDLYGHKIEDVIFKLEEFKISNCVQVDFAIAILRQCKVVAASALTQAPDRKKPRLGRTTKPKGTKRRPRG